MLKQRFYIAGLVILLAGMTLATPFTNHITRLDEVMVGAFGNPDIQFVEMSIGGCDQNIWAPQSDFGSEPRARLAFFDENDNETGEFLMPTNPPCGNNRKVLIATRAFADLPSTPTPDFIMPPGMAPVSGKVCFRDNPDAASAFDVVLCLSYGNFTGDSEQGSVGNAPEMPSSCVSPSFTSGSLTKVSGFFFGDPNFNDDFQVQTPTPENAAGTIGDFSNFCDAATTFFGDVGIGTATPDAALHVEMNGAQLRMTATDSIAASRTLVRLENNGRPGLRFSNSASSGASEWTLEAGDNGDFLWRQNNGANPGIKLLVNDNSGNLTVSGDVITSSCPSGCGPADFVFEPDYELMPLKELAEFVRKEKHLPNIPSARELEAGVKITWLQMRLLEKIEELTLYALQQQERIDVIRQEKARIREEMARMKTQNAQILERLSTLEATLKAAKFDH